MPRSSHIYSDSIHEAEADPQHRRIAHLDMDAFYASVELLQYPQLRGHPVVVGGRRTNPPVAASDGRLQFGRLGDYTGRGVATTATYEARALGVHSGMGLMTAGRLAPDAVLLPADFDAYRHYSRRFKGAVRTLASTIEDRGIDEIYIDLTCFDEDSAQVAGRIRRAVHDATGLTCSMGVAPNKLLAKIASELDKPNGLTVLGLDDLAGRIWPLAVDRINGIGRKASARLQALGIRTIGELAQADLTLLQREFGSNTATWLHRSAHGRDDRPIVTESEPKSLSRETTFERDLHPREDRALLTAALVGLCERVSADLQGKGYFGRTVGIKLRFEDFQILTREVTLEVPVRQAEVLLSACREGLRRAPLDRRLRLLGVRVGSLVPEHALEAQPAHGFQTELPFEPEAPAGGDEACNAV